MTKISCMDLKLCKCYHYDICGHALLVVLVPANPTHYWLVGPVCYVLTYRRSFRQTLLYTLFFYKQWVYKHTQPQITEFLSISLSIFPASDLLQEKFYSAIPFILFLKLFQIMINFFHLSQANHKYCRNFLRVEI